jgi:hypothetical protein
MSVLDLQAMATSEAQTKGGPPNGSRSSKGCNSGGPDTNTSTLSVAICAF